MAYRARTFKIDFRCYVDPEVYTGFNIALCIAGQLPTSNPIQQLYVKPVYNPAGWYEYTFYDFFLDDTKTYDVFVQAITFNKDSFWRNIGGIEIPDDGRGTITDNDSPPQPDSVTGFTYQQVETGVILQWSPSYDYHLSHYEIRKGASWAAGTPVYTGKNTSHMLPMITSGTYKYLIKSFNTANQECLSDVSVTFTILKPAAPSVTAKITGENVKIEWTAPFSTFPIVEYELRQGSTVIGKFKSTIQTLKSPSAGTYTYSVQAINAVGEYGNTGQADITITAPGPVVVYPQVIDNNVLLKWSAPQTGSLPIVEYEVRKGVVFASATSIGRINSLFTVVFESQAGNYTYWISAIDSSGNEGSEAYCIAAVSQPPDYILHDDRNSDFVGTKTSCLITENDTLLTPIDTAQTWASHYTSQGRTTPQAQIDAGFPFYIEPSLTSGQYIETIDYGEGLTISTSKVSINIESRLLHGSVNIACKIETSLNGSTWTDHGTLFEAYAKDFRFVRYTLSFTASSSGQNLLEIDNINIKLSVKKKGDSGTAACLSSDTGGTVVLFNEPFLDVISINVTAKYDGTVAYALYDFADVPNPASFKIFLYDKSGVRVSGTASWEVKGV